LTIELLILRHGQSQADLEDRHEGRADFPLTELGREQARRVGSWLAGRYQVDRILASTLIRAAATAEIVGRALGVTVEPDPALMEFNNGELAGMLKSESRVRFGPMFGDRTELAPYERFPGGETMVEMRARAEHFLSKLLDETEDGTRVLLVSHGGMIAQLFRAYLSLPVETRVFTSTGDTGLHLWEVSGHRRRIRFMNSLVHLEGLPEHS
jgi:2,3-bisphosphoglycerate-dependent phosphoglycerate mutase